MSGGGQMTTSQRSGEIEVLYRPATPPSQPEARYPGFEPGSTTLRQGTVVERGARPLPCDILSERDVAVTLRDGTIIYTDIFRPAGSSDVPALVAWSPYGKRGGATLLDDFPNRGGVPRDVVSGLQKWEAPDPAYWCFHGYAIVNPDARGVGSSEGDIHFFGEQEGADGHDLIEWVAEQPWSNGRVGLAGNSWLAVSQWFIAASHPPHLVAIAPWEGFTDLYRHSLGAGGIPTTSFMNMITSKLAGQRGVEDTIAMLERHPLWDAYWATKRARCEEIDIPAYVVASWTNPLHSTGTFEGFRRLGSTEKWLRVHNTHEWPDLYQYSEDLRRFFDHYLAGVDNSWEQTPRVRLSILDPGGVDTIERLETEFPLERAQQRKLYLDASNARLGFEQPTSEATNRYVADDGRGRAEFTFRFSEPAELIGHLKLRLWVEADGSDDMDLFVLVQKLDAAGELLSHVPVSPFDSEPLPGHAHFVGAKGRLRVSRRELDPSSTPAEPMLSVRREEPLKPGDVVRVEIGVSPLGMRWRAGEQLRVVVGGFDLAGPVLPGVLPPTMKNRGSHVIHTGGRYDSHLLVPYVAERVAG